MSSKILFYVHFNKYNQLSDHVVYQLDKMAPLFQRVVLISNSDLSKKDLDKLSYNDFIQRENKGFDFAGWKMGVDLIGDELEKYDSATFMNDTTFGPLYDLKPYYDKYEKDPLVDFWGITNHRNTKQVKEHLQSYFVVYNQNVLQSEIFKNFWQNVEVLDDVSEVIEKYETSFTRTLMINGFSYASVLNTKNMSTNGMLYPDFSFWNPTQIILNNVPFLKVKAVGAFKNMTPFFLNELKLRSQYPINLIYSHMTRFVELPDEPYLLENNFLDLNKPNENNKQKIAIHFHVFYTDLVDDFFKYFAEYNFKFKLFITTDIKEKVSEIESKLKQYNLMAQILVTGNVGRDILPMLKLKKQLSKFDIIGHFHTKKSKEADFLVGESWRNELINMLVKPANQIVTSFEENENLGLLIADIPSFFRFNAIVNPEAEHKIAPKMNKLWKQMKLQKTINFITMNTFVMSYGTFLWFKYDAVKPLFDLNLSEADVPKEPLPQSSILHAIERIMVYLVWNNFYEFKISPNTKSTPFIDNKVLNSNFNMTINNDNISGKQALKIASKKLILKVKGIKK
ncbi:MAG: rhamnan synthesis F family protein [Lactobacillaceae bacterium]|jgi:rhamnosyltransferase|nr:rhamnan synthesis F family protein [Lactobacillaceae bacterium]